MLLWVPAPPEKEETHPLLILLVQEVVLQLYPVLVVAQAVELEGGVLVVQAVVMVVGQVVHRAPDQQVMRVVILR